VRLEWAKLIESLNWTFLFNLVNFALLLYVLKRLLFKPALAYLDRRREMIAARMEAARTNEERAARLASDGETALAAAHETSRRAIEEAAARREAMIAEAKAEAEREARRIVEDGRRQLKQERAQMEAELRVAYADLAVLGASRVLRREVNVEDHRRLLEELLTAIDEEELRVEK
jgi:F-type H+-transporting ATPase subunit b